MGGRIGRGKEEDFQIKALVISLLLLSCCASIFPETVLGKIYS